MFCKPTVLIFISITCCLLQNGFCDNDYPGKSSDNTLGLSGDEAITETDDPQTKLSTLEIPQDSLISVNLKDGSQLNGRIIRRDSLNITFRTFSGLQLEIPLQIIKSFDPVQGREDKGEFRRFDPNYSRLLFAPTGRPLAKGKGYISDYYIFFPGVSYGFTNNISAMAGFSILPGMDFSEQMYYLAPRFGFYISKQFSVSAGALYMSNIDAEVAAGLGFMVATYGPQDRSLTAGIGFGFFKDEDSDFRFHEYPIIMLGGNWRLSNSIALISENWIITGTDFNLSSQPFSIAMRFFGSRIAVDFGFLLIGEVLKEGFPVPWLSFAYNF